MSPLFADCLDWFDVARSTTRQASIDFQSAVSENLELQLWEDLQHIACSPARHYKNTLGIFVRGKSMDVYRIAHIPPYASLAVAQMKDWANVWQHELRKLECPIDMT